MDGLTDREQAVISLVSAALISSSIAVIPAGAPWYISLVLGIAGAVGFGIKEALGGKKPT